MNTKKYYLIVLFILFTIFPMSTHLCAQIGFDKKNIIRKNEPIEIASNRMEAFNEKKMVVFSGNVVAIQNDIKLTTDRLSIFYKKSNAKKEKIGKQEIEGVGDLDRIELKGNVFITQKDISASGNEAVYYQESAKCVLSGKPVLRQGDNVIKGCRVLIYINENRGEVERCDSENSGRVTAVIHPQEKK